MTRLDPLPRRPIAASQEERGVKCFCCNDTGIVLRPWMIRDRHLSDPPVLCQRTGCDGIMRYTANGGYEPRFPLDAMDTRATHEECEGLHQEALEAIRQASENPEAYSFNAQKIQQAVSALATGKAMPGIRPQDRSRIEEEALQRDERELGRFGLWAEETTGLDEAAIARLDDEQRQTLSDAFEQIEALREIATEADTLEDWENFYEFEEQMQAELAENGWLKPRRAA